MPEKVCSRRNAIVQENERRLKTMHPRAPEIDEETLTIKGLIEVCEAPVFMISDNPLFEGTYLCARCRKDVGGALEAKGAKIRPLPEPKA
jgi:hypothetical protein